MSDKIDEKKINVLKLETQYLKENNAEPKKDFFIDLKIIPAEWYESDNLKVKKQVLMEALEKKILIAETESYNKFFHQNIFRKEGKIMQGTGEKYLPIGTVVMLKEGEKRIMITGFCVSQGKDKNEIWDYSGCLYPEGVINSNQVMLFNHDQIETVYYYGLIDGEEREFKKALTEYIQNGMKQETKNDEENKAEATEDNA